jgi:hypothetical protein
MTAKASGATPMHTLDYAVYSYRRDRFGDGRR